MQWDKVQHNCHSLALKQANQKTILDDVANFWRGFASDVLPLTLPDVWDYLLIDVRGIDGGISVYPQHSAEPPFRTAWARIDMHQLGREFEALDESELADNGKSLEINRWYAQMLVEAAQYAGLAALIGKSQSVLLRFVAYSEDQKPPFLEVAV